jgi:hypothetical protein
MADQCSAEPDPRAVPRSRLGGGEMPASPDEMRAAGRADPHPLEEVVCWLERMESQQRGLDATRVRLIAAAMDQVLGVSIPTASGLEGVPRNRSGAKQDLAYRSLRAELATAFALSEHQVEVQMDLAHRLSHQYAATLAALERGEIGYAHTRVIADAGVVIGPGDAPDPARRRANYEREVLAVAKRETPNRLRPIARRIAEQWAERPLEERHREAVLERRVVVVEAEDGMADLIARLPAVEAYAIHDRLSGIARAAERGERVIRTGAPAARSRDQLRADAFADLLLSADERTLFAGSTAEAVQARVQVIVPIDSRSICELVGSGPIGDDVARSIAAETVHWDRVTVRQGTGEVIAVDRYRPSEQMRRLLGARDRHCRFPGCRVPASRCDIDHTVDAAHGGPTSTDNLAHLCRGHHVLKHHSEWRVVQESGGTLRWTSPTGRQHLDRPRGARTEQGSAKRLGEAEPPGRRRSVRFGRDNHPEVCF